jgi:hypothetical protein
MPSTEVMETLMTEVMKSTQQSWACSISSNSRQSEQKNLNEQIPSFFKFPRPAVLCEVVGFTLWPPLCQVGNLNLKEKLFVTAPSLLIIKAECNTLSIYHVT